MINQCQSIEIPIIQIDSTIDNSLMSINGHAFSL